MTYLETLLNAFYQQKPHQVWVAIQSVGQDFEYLVVARFEIKKIIAKKQQIPTLKCCFGGSWQFSCSVILVTGEAQSISWQNKSYSHLCKGRLNATVKIQALPTLRLQLFKPFISAGITTKFFLNMGLSWPLFGFTHC